MKLFGQRVRRLASVFFLAALLLVPVLESGHSHVNGDLAKPCATCVVTHHSPVASAAIVAAAAPVMLAAVAIFTTASSPVFRHHSPQSGRAPPLSFSIAG